MATEAGSPVEIFKTVMTKKYADFSGRARRAEYWWFFLIQVVVFFILGFIAGVLAGVSDSLGSVALILSAVVYLAFLIPGIAVSIRRLHDIGKSGWWLLVGLIPFGSFVLLYFSVLDSNQGTNAYGPSPKYGA